MSQTAALLRRRPLYGLSASLLLVFHTIGLSSQRAHGDLRSTAGLEVTSLSLPEAGALWILGIEVLSPDDLHNTRLRITGNTAGVAAEERLLGFVGAGEFIENRLEVQVPAQGAATVSIELLADRVDVCGRVAEVRDRVDVYVESDGGRAAFGIGSALAARLALAVQQQQAGLIGPEELAARLDQAMLDASGTATVRALPAKDGAAQSADSVSFQLVWRDPLGGLHPARRCNARLIQVVYDPVRGLETIIQNDSRRLDDDGRVTLRSRPVSRGFELRRHRIEVEAENGAAAVYVPATGSAGADCLLGLGKLYRFVREAPALADLERSYALEDAGALHGAFSVVDAIIPAADWVGGLPRASILFPTDGLPTTEQLSKCIGIPSRSAFSWDVIHHEFGHFANLQREFVATIGFFDPRNNACLLHSLCSTLYPNCPHYSTAAKTALGEGFANWFAIAAQEARPQLLDGMPYTGNTCIAEDVFPQCIDIAFRHGCSADPIGETSELNISRILYGLGARYGSDRLLNLLRSREPASLVEIWTVLTDGLDVAEKLGLAELFEKNLVAPAPLAPPDNFVPNASAPLLFSWKKNGLNQFRIRFYDAQQKEIPDSQIDVPGDVDQWEVTAQQMSRVLVGCGANFWVIEGRHSDGAADQWYWSTARRLGGGVDFCFVIDDTGSMEEEIGGVRDGLQSFLLGFDAASTATAFQLITFKDEVTARAPTCDLAEIQAQVAGLRATGGGDCPEDSFDALHYGGLVTKRGGTIFFATDADPYANADLEGLIGQLQASGARVQIVLRGSCSEAGTGGGAAAKASVDSATLRQPGAKSGLRQATRYSNAVDAYARIAAATGGSFAFIPENSPQSLSDFQRSIENSLAAALGPSVVLLTPRVLRQGAAATVTLAAQNTSFAANSLVEFSHGIQVTAVQRLDPVTLAVDVFVPADATPGYADVSVFTPLTTEHTEVATGLGALRIEPNWGRAALVSAYPAVVEQGQRALVRVNAQNSNFANGVTTLDLGPGIVVEGITVVSPTSLNASIAVEPNASAGFRAAYAKSGGELVRNESAEFFRVLAAPAPAPTIVQVEPAQAAPGAVVDVVVTLSHVALSPEDTTLEITGTGVMAGNLVACGEELVARVTVDCAAPAGARDVIVRTNAAVIAKPNAFVVVGDPCPTEETREVAPIVDAGLCPSVAAGAVAFSAIGMALARRERGRA